MKRGLLLVLILAASSVGGIQAGASPGTIDATVGPLIAGTGSYVGGTYAWTDYAYDDNGANTNTTPGGDVVYPAAVTELNAADLIQLQLSFTPDADLRIRAILETLIDPGRPLLGVGFDTDDDPSTGAATIPGARWTTSEGLGLDSFITVAGDGGALWRWEGAAWTQAAGVPATIDPVSNSMEAIVPRSALDPVGATWRTIGVLGLALSGATWLDGTGAVYDAAFVRAEDPCSLPGTQPAVCVGNPDNQLGQNQRQADVLAGKLDVHNAVGLIDFTKIRDGLTELATAAARGYHTLLYYSPLALGEGIRTVATAVRSTALPHDVYAGPYQPYVVRIPGPLTEPMPAIVYLHGRSGNHLQGFINNFASFDPPAIVVGVLGRGPEVGFGGLDWLGFVEPDGAYGEQDVLDVLADLQARALIDPSRVIVTGISMGGVGVFHLAEFYPDRFMAAVPIVGGDGGIAPANWGPGLLENLTNVRVRQANGGIDPLAHLPGSQFAPAILRAFGDVDFRAYVALRRHHEWQAGLVDCVFTELLDEPRTGEPARVVYGVNPAFEVHVPASGLHVSHDGAFWVSGLVLRPDALDPASTTLRSALATSPATGRIDVTSLAMPVRSVVSTPVAGVGENFTAGADYCGPNESAHSNDVWEVNGIALGPGPAQPTVNGASMTLSGFSDATLDLTRMGIGITEPITLTIRGDGETALTLLGPWATGAQVTVARHPVSALDPLVPPPTQSSTVTATDGALVITGDFSGTSEVQVIP